MAASPTEKPSRLLDLSAELRNKIYSLLLEDEDSVTIIESSGQHRARDVDRLSSHSNIQPAILRTCRQIYNEASSILYTKGKLRLAISPGLTPYFMGFSQKTRYRLNNSPGDRRVQAMWKSVAKFRVVILMVSIVLRSVTEPCVY